MKLLIVALTLIALLGPAACTSRFEEINTDPTRISSATLDNPAAAVATANALFSSAVANGLMRSFEFQRVQSLYADLYAQYYANSAVYFASDQYQVNQAWLNAGWNLFYPRDINNLVLIIAAPNTSNNQKQIARIWKAFLFHRMVDFYGDIPYFSAAQPGKPEVFDSQQAIYTDMLKELSEAATALDVLPAAVTYDSKDPIYSGNAASWRAFANSLRMRLAMRISRADPARARTEFLAAMPGAFQSNATNALARVNDQNRNALNEITGFGEFRMSATMESLMVGYNDPRTGEYYSPAATDNAFRGIRNGTTPSTLGTAANNANSNVGPRFSRTTMAATPRIVLTYAETCFLMSEAVINGWTTTGGTAREWYERGVTASMNQFGITNAPAITTYLASTTVPTTPLRTTRPVSTLPVVWSTNATAQREQVAIQRYLATYPDGFEGWSEFRRTGFPRFYTPANYDPTATVPVGEFIQRLPYTDQMRGFNAAGVKAAEARMGGDGQNVRLWFAGGK